MLLFNLLQTENDFWGMILMLCAYVSALLLSLSFHEFAHAHAAFKEGDKTAKALGRYTLAPHAHIDFRGIFFLLIFGYGWAKPVPVDSRNFKRGKLSAFRVYSAGIFANLAIGILATAIYSAVLVFVPYVFASNAYGAALSNFLEYMIVLNFVYAFFNLLPFYAFDGYRLIETFTKPNGKFVDFMRRYSFIILLVCIFTGLISAYVDLVPINLANWIMEGFIELFSLMVI